MCPQEDKNGLSLLPEYHSYYTQVQGQMAVMDFKVCDFVVWATKDLTVVHVEYHIKHWKIAKAHLDKFYMDHVVPSPTQVTAVAELKPATAAQGV